MLTKLGEPEGLVMDIDAVVARLRGAEEDKDEIETMLKAATARFEQRSGRIMVPTNFEYRSADWCDLDIPVVPLRSITGVAYLDANNAKQQLDASDWYYDSDDRFARLRFVDGFEGPALSDRDLPVTVSLEAGYDDPNASGSGDDPKLMQNPMDVQAILMLTAHWYQRRSISSDYQIWDLPAAFEDLVSERRIYR
jgi:uncharacterized phiE125 gp8 family phage protein